MKKRILSVLLALTMLLGLVTTAQAYGATLTITQQPSSEDGYTVTATSEAEISYQWYRRSGAKVYTLTKTNTNGDDEIPVSGDSFGEYSETVWSSDEDNSLWMFYYALPGDEVTVTLLNGTVTFVEFCFDSMSGTDGVYTASYDRDDPREVSISVDSTTAFSATITVTRSWEKLTGETGAALQTREPGTYVCQVSGDYGSVLLSDQVTLSGPVTAHSHPVCGAACPGHTESHGNVTWTEFPTGSTTLTGGSYYLTGDITTSGAFSISGEVNLCLNGHKIESTANLRTILINSGATLNLCDCIGTGAIIDNSNTCIEINNSSGKVNMYGGSVSGNTRGISNQGNVNIYGGSVSGTSANSSGISSSTATSTLNVYGGSIAGKFRGIYGTGGTVNVYDGAITGIDTGSSIVIATSGSVNVSGGTISGGTYGISHSGSGAFTLGGNPSIHGGTTDTDADLYFGNGNTVTVDSTLTSSATYSVKTKTAPTEAAPVAITAAASADYSGHFTSVSASYAIRNSGSDSDQVVQLYKPHSHSWANDWQTDATHHWHDCTATDCPVTENSEKDGYAAHTSVAIGTAVAATCNTAGMTAGSKCDLCGYIITPQETIPATGAHTSVTDAAVAATCTTAGKTEGSHCDLCGTILVAQTDIPAINHNYGAWTITAEPTLTTGGAATQVCENDGTHKNMVTLPTLNDTTVWTAGTRAEPTENTDGSQVYTSEYGTVTVTIPATRPAHTHAYGDWSHDETNHWHECTASDCPAQDKGKKDETAHTEDSGIVTTAPTGTGAGVKTYKCTVCERVLRTEDIPALGFGISGKVTDSTDTAVSGAVVKLMRGNEQIGASVTTDTNGDYSFSDVTPGTYNVVAEQGGVTKTILVKITNQNAVNQNIQMPDGKKNSVVEVKSNTPAVVVGGVDEIADNETVTTGDTVTVKLTVETKTESAAVGASAIKQTASGKTLEYIDLTLTKQINNGVEDNIGSNNDQLLTIVIPFTKGDKQNITVYRYHGSQAETLPTAANSDGEYFTVGDTAITVYAKKFSTYAIGYTAASQTTYTLTVNGGTGSGSYAAGATVNISAITPSGKRFTGWTGATVANAGSASTTLTMPAQNTTVTANFADSTPTPTPQPSYGGGSYSPTTYPVDMPDSIPNGTVSVSPKSAGSGSTVTITVTPDEGYEIGKVTVTDKDGKEIIVIDKGNGKYTFTMPAGKVAISAGFTKVRGSYADCPKDYTCPIWPYTNAIVTAWYHDGVHYCIENGLMSGYGNYIFGPDDDSSRAMIATILWKLEGSPVVNYILPFDDVAEGTWYTEAIRWAAASGIVSGYGNGLFGPNDNITREQLVTMFYHYEQYKGGGFTGAWMSPLNYTDAELISSWAYEPMCWTTMNGIVEGIGNGLFDPKGKATRAQAATMTMQFCQLQK